ncbi:diguanylate cyclase domain-containing protein [Oceanisphaera sp.]|uniref:diguanylate cyclase domain-containing protein n=1 Tax=Oceanisphaera sp. TaxID=1929979 RepID=UPI003A8E0233
MSLNHRRVLLPYMAGMALTELAIMLLMRPLGLDILGFWLVTLFDATAVALTAIILFFCLTSRDLGHAGGLRPDAQLKVGAIVFVTELLIMLLLPLDDHGWQMALFDAALLSVVSGLLIYWQVLLPMRRSRYIQNDETSSSLFWGALFAYLSLMICASIVLLSVYQQQQQHQYAEVSAAEMSSLDIRRRELLASLHEVALDLTLLAGQAERRVAATGFHLDEQQLVTDYLAYLKVRPSYAQLRLIDRQGEERVRVERDQGRLVKVPAGQLQNKRYHDYFVRAMQAEKGEIYISELDLNIEHGRIEVPHNPVIRLATPVFDETGTKQGIVIVNLMASHWLKGLAPAGEPLLNQLMLLHHEGGWLYGVEEERHWGSVLEERRHHSFANSHPTAWKQMQEHSAGFIRAPEGLYVYQKLTAPDHPGLGSMSPRVGARTSDQAELQPPHWWLVSVIDNAVFKQGMAKLRNLLLMVSLFFAVLTAIGIQLFCHTLRKRIEAERKLHQLAHFDFLTGLTNRALFTRILEQELERSRRSGADSVLFYMDLDNFKPINDRFGHEAGDAALKEVALRLQQSVRPYDTVARLGGDEFAILFSGPVQQEDIETLARRVLDAFVPPVEVAGQSFQLGVSIGITQLHRGFDNHHQALAVADNAMYNAKQAGKQGFFVAPSVPQHADDVA